MGSPRDAGNLPNSIGRQCPVGQRDEIRRRRHRTKAFDFANRAWYKKIIDFFKILQNFFAKTLIGDQKSFYLLHHRQSISSFLFDS